MRALILAALVAAFAINTGNAQDEQSKRKSPPATAKAVVGDMNVVVEYSQPSVKGRTIWGDLVPYGKVWRTGANEATIISFSKEAMVNGKKLKPGNYSLFTIPGENEWTVILNSVAEQWGAYKYDESKDVVRMKVKPENAGEAMEMLTFMVDKSGMVTMHWDKLKVSFKVEQAK